MGNCRYCGASTRNHCVACMEIACDEHMIKHYQTQQHRAMASHKHIPIDSNGVPISEE